MNPPLIYLIVFLASFVFCVLLTPLIRRAALKGNLVARPRDDRWHKRPTALLGGVSLFVVLMAIWQLSFLQLGLYSATKPLVPLALGCLAIFLLGLADDLFDINPQHKLVGQIIIASLLVIFGFQVQWFTSRTANLVISIFWLVAITNAFNLLDNMDGLSAGVAFIAGLFLFLSRAFSGLESVVPALLVLAVFLGSLLGFLIYNFHPASIFMGDSGSLLVGFLIAGLTTEASGLMAGRQSGHLVFVLAIPILILFIPILDTAFVSLMRKISGRPISMGGQDHSSHRMVAIGFSERTAVLTLYGFAGISGLLAVAVSRLALGVSVVLVVMYLLFIVFFWITLARVKVYQEESVIPGAKEGTLTPLLLEITYRRRLFEVLLDLVLIPLAYWISYLLRFEGSAYGANFPVFIKSLPIVVACQLFAFFLLGVYRGIWQYVGMRDVIVFGKAITAGTVLSVLVNLGVFRFMGFSRTVFVIHWFILFALVTASRFSYRLIGEATPKEAMKKGKRALIYGAGAGGQLVMQEIEGNRNLGLALVGFIDDDMGKQNRRFLGYPVFGGKDSLREVAQKQHIAEVIVSFRNIDKEAMNSLKKDCSALGVNLSQLHIVID
ncbi:MAG: glycosyl transferase [Deltaproteobacteria bacterium]|nr:glycosyl transferase [Deltaproteobacteria bacterium]MBW2078628.1 glycosyl transferase [Deltaproteobacteria bacterium]